MDWSGQGPGIHYQCVLESLTFLIQKRVCVCICMCGDHPALQNILLIFLKFFFILNFNLKKYIKKKHQNHNKVSSLTCSHISPQRYPLYHLLQIRCFARGLDLRTIFLLVYFFFH